MPTHSGQFAASEAETCSLCLSVGLAHPLEYRSRVSWEEYAIRGIVALLVFGALFILAGLRWRARNKDRSDDDQKNDPGFD